MLSRIAQCKSEHALLFGYFYLIGSAVIRAVVVIEIFDLVEQIERIRLTHSPICAYTVNESIAVKVTVSRERLRVAICLSYLKRAGILAN